MKINKKATHIEIAITKEELKNKPKLASLIKKSQLNEDAIGNDPSRNYDAHPDLGPEDDFDTQQQVEETPEYNDAIDSLDVKSDPTVQSTEDSMAAISAIEQIFSDHGKSLPRELALQIEQALLSSETAPSFDKQVADAPYDDSLPPEFNSPNAKPPTREFLDKFDQLNSLKYPDHDSTFSSTTGRITSVGNQEGFNDRLLSILAQQKKMCNRCKVKPAMESYNTCKDCHEKSTDEGERATGVQ